MPPSLTRPLYTLILIVSVKTPPAYTYSILAAMRKAICGRGN
jgi:hypothetical protein